MSKTPWQTLFRIAIGFLLIPVFARLRQSDDSALDMWLFLLLVLLALRIVPAVIRHAIPFPKETQALWFRLRILAKQYDSYQWRKLLWLGIGIAAYLAVQRGASRAQGSLALGCLAAGALGEWYWQRAARTDPVLRSELR